MLLVSLPQPQQQPKQNAPVQPFSIDFLAIDAGLPLVFSSSDDLGQLVNRKLRAGLPAARRRDQLLPRAPPIRRDRLLEAHVKLLPYLEPPLRRYHRSRGMPFRWQPLLLLLLVHTHQTAQSGVMI